MSEGKYLSLWTKYLPIFRILLKKSLAEEQQVSMGKLELHSADNRKNVNYSFSVSIVKGKVENGIGGSAIGKDLFTVLTNDLIVYRFMNDKSILIKMGRDFQLTIKSVSLAPPAVEESAASTQLAETEAPSTQPADLENIDEPGILVEEETLEEVPKSTLEAGS